MALSLQSVVTSKSTPYILVTVLGVIGVACGLHAGHTLAEWTTYTTRYTARAAFLPFIVTYCASSLVRLWPNQTTRGIMRNRFHWGTSYAIAMAIQGVCFIPWMAMPLPPGVPEFPRFLGTFYYFTIFGMALTPLKAAARSGTLVAVKRFHTFGMHALWLSFALQYWHFATAPGARPLTAGPCFAICIAMLGLRIAAWSKTQIDKSHAKAAATSNA